MSKEINWFDFELECLEHRRTPLIIQILGVTIQSKWSIVTMEWSIVERFENVATVGSEMERQYESFEMRYKTHEQFQKDSSQWCGSPRSYRKTQHVGWLDPKWWGCPPPKIEASFRVSNWRPQSGRGQWVIHCQKLKLGPKHALERPPKVARESDVAIQYNGFG